MMLASSRTTTRRKSLKPFSAVSTPGSVASSKRLFLLWLQGVRWRRLRHERIGVAMDHAPRAVLSAEQVSDPQRHRCWFLFANDAHGAAFDGNGVTEVAVLA